MSEQAIPDDVLEAAGKIVSRNGLVAGWNHLIRDIAAALLAERQKATTAERDRWMAYHISETDRLLNRVR